VTQFQQDQQAGGIVQSLLQKKVVVLGGSRGVGRVIAQTLNAAGAHVMAVARNQDALMLLTQQKPKIETLVLDVTEERAPEAVFERMRPDALVVCAGAKRTGSPFYELEWSEFAETWDIDVKASFLFCRAAIQRPLPHGAVIILISSGAALGGSPISGGYAGAKRMQMFLANYAQKESDRLGLGLRFLAVTPMRPMVDTEGGRAAVASYTKYLGISAEEFVKGMDAPQTAQDVANAVLSLVATPPDRACNVFIVSGKGVEALK
jgi:NAD(P)-dependent dehydrogenase (short-subunit alcohol dehydrogenase family)